MVVTRGWTLLQLPACKTGSRNHPLVRDVNQSIPDCLVLWLDTSFNCWPLGKHHYSEIHAVCMSIQTEGPPLWSGLLSSPARATALCEYRGHCLTCHEDSNSLRQCRHPFPKLSGILNPDLGTFGLDREGFRFAKTAGSDTVP